MICFEEKNFGEKVDEVCKNIEGDLKELRKIFEEYENSPDELTEELRTLKKALEEMESGLSWIY